MSANRFDAFMAHWEPAFRGTQGCLIVSWSAPEIRRLCDLACACLARAIHLAHDTALENLETHGFHDIAAPEPPPNLTPNLRHVLARRINNVAAAPTRCELQGRLDIETRSAIGLIGEGGVTPVFLAKVLGRAASDCKLAGEPSKARAFRRMHSSTAQLIVLHCLDAEMGSGGADG